MRLSVSFSGFGGLADTLPIVDAAEEHGLDGVWTAEHLGFHDAVVPSALYIGRTSRIEVGLVGLSTASRHPGSHRDGAHVDVRAGPRPSASTGRPR